MKKDSVEMRVKKRANTMAAYSHQQSLVFNTLKKDNYQEIKGPDKKKSSIEKPSDIQNKKRSYSKSQLGKNSDPQITSTFLLTNKLTKPTYSFRDSSMVHKVTLSKLHRHHSTSKIKGANSTLLQRYNTVGEQTENQQNAQNVTQASIPVFKINRNKKQGGKQSRDFMMSQPRSLAKSMKFKLLFRQSNENKRLTKSQRKMNKIDGKIQKIQSHRRYLSSLLPPPKPNKPKEQIRQKIDPVEPIKVQKLAFMLIRNLQLYFNMYLHPKKVGDMLKAVEGYNKQIHRILFTNQFMAKRIVNPKELTDYFWEFREPNERPRMYEEEDQYFFNTLQNFAMKMEKSHNDIKQNFANAEQLSMQFKYKEMEKAYTDYEQNNKIKISPKLKEINQFLYQNKALPQNKRQSSLRNLESLGVRFNVEQRSRQLVIREKETILKKLRK